MGITLDRVTGNYEVLDLILEHNHVLHLPKTFHLMTKITCRDDKKYFKMLPA
jgi:hypothetical protein